MKENNNYYNMERQDKEIAQLRDDLREHGTNMQSLSIKIGRLETNYEWQARSMDELNKQVKDSASAMESRMNSLDKSIGELKELVSRGRGFWTAVRAFAYVISGSGATMFIMKFLTRIF